MNLNNKRVREVVCKGTRNKSRIFYRIYQNVAVAVAVVERTKTRTLEKDVR